MATSGLRYITDPFVFTIFGASGDLAKLKIFPALFELAEQKRFREDFVIIGFSRSERGDEVFRSEFGESVKKAFEGKWDDRREKVLKELLEHVWYFRGQYDLAEDFEKYREFRNKLVGAKSGNEKRESGGNREKGKEKPKANSQQPIANGPFIQEVFYFSVPPVVFEPIVGNLKKIESEETQMRMVMEKPFGEDECSATHLYHFIGERFSDDQVFLLDHYLGKKTVRSILPLRYSNRLLQSVINGREIANIQISALEPYGVGQRLGYFDDVGIVKDFLQSHLLQVLSLLTMSIPIEQSSFSIHQEKQAMIHALHFSPKKENLVLGQYESYQDYDASVQKSQTPTYAAVKLYFNRDEWYKVPIYIRCGKKLDRRHTYIVIELERHGYQKKEPNRIIIEMAPSEEIRLTILDEDDHTQEVSTISSSGSLACQGDFCLPEHGILLLDVLANERSHFVSFSEILGSWHIVDRILSFAKEEKIVPKKYKDGSTGPGGELSVDWYEA